MGLSGFPLEFSLQPIHWLEGWWPWLWKLLKTRWDYYNWPELGWLATVVLVADPFFIWGVTKTIRNHPKPLLIIWLVVWNMFFSPIYWEFHHPNWLSYFSEGWLNHQPVMIGSSSGLFSGDSSKIQHGNHWEPLSTSRTNLQPGFQRCSSVAISPGVSLLNIYSPAKMLSFGIFQIGVARIWSWYKIGFHFKTVFGFAIYELRLFHGEIQARPWWWATHPRRASPDHHPKVPRFWSWNAHWTRREEYTKRGFP